jgi:hypothetical protein
MRTLARAALGLGVALVIPMSVNAQQPLACTDPDITESPARRWQPAVMIDQALESLPHVEPGHRLLVVRRSGTLAGREYALLAYTTPAGDSVRFLAQQVEGVEVAWTISRTCPHAGWVMGLIDLLERMAALRRPATIPQ